MFLKSFLCLLNLNLHNYIVFCMYFMFIFLFLNCSSMVHFWILLELNMIFFVFLMNMNLMYGDNLDLTNKNFYYFFIQSLGSFIFLFSLISNNFLFDNFMEIFLLVSMSVKMGSFPFHFWVVEISEYLNYVNFTFLMTFQKIPSFFIFFNMNLNLIFLFLFVNMFTGSIMLYFSLNLKNLIISSSIYNLFWMFIFYILSSFLFLFFFFNFFFINFMLAKEKMKTNIKISMCKKNVILMMVLMFLVSLPPLSMFFMKVYVLEMMNKTFSLLNLLIIFFCTFLSVFSYFKFFFLEIIEIKYMYMNLKMKLYYYLIFTLSLFSFMIL